MNAAIGSSAAHPPSIFNDVIGPVMRGPSSSHCAAALRIGRLARDLMGGSLREVHIVFDPEGSLATTHTSQGSDMGLAAGLLGWKPTDHRLPDAVSQANRAGIRITTGIEAIAATHPNTYRMTLGNLEGRRRMTALSIGGGMVRVTEIDGFATDIAGDCFHTLIVVRTGGRALRDDIIRRIGADGVDLIRGATGELVTIKAQRFLDDDLLEELHRTHGVVYAAKLSPVLPVLTRRSVQVPFTTPLEMMAHETDPAAPLWQRAVAYESARAGVGPERVMAMMDGIVAVMRQSLADGLAGTDWGDRILGCQSSGFGDALAAGRLLDAGILNTATRNVTAVMEVKSALGVIVAAPTAGSCGVLPGVCFAAAGNMGLSDGMVTRAMLAAGLIGVFIAANATLAAETGGCQAECGAASGMAAAALVTLADGSCRQAVDAAAMALQNSFGMICDPVANRVEVPCLGKNVMAAANALASANMALAGFDAVVPLDQVITAMDAVGRSLPPALRCTGLGGLSVTPAAAEIQARLNQDG
jgi:L-serine dehydratase